MADSFKFELVSPERLLVSQDVETVVVPGTEGEMTVMANHAPLMTSIQPGIVTATLPDGKSERYVVFGGFAEIQPDNCTVLAESATEVSALDPADIAQRISNAREDVAGLRVHVKARWLLVVPILLVHLLEDLRLAAVARRERIRETGAAGPKVNRDHGLEIARGFDRTECGHRTWVPR